MSSVALTNKDIVTEIFINQLGSENDDFQLKETKRLGFFSFYYNDENKGVYNQDRSALRYLDVPFPVAINCLQGYQPNVHYGHKQPKGSNLLRWIVENESNLYKFDFDFICNNGLLKEIMTVKYNNRDWSFSATKIRGKIVLIRTNSIEEKASIDARGEKDNQSTYVANNLLRLITKNSNSSECSSGKQCESFYGVFHSNIGSHQILHSGYLDGVESKKELEKPFEEMEFVSIKKFNAPRKEHTDFQSDTWWSLAVLARVGTIVRAKCERDFTVKKIDKLKVGYLINRHRQMRFFATLNSILDHIKEIVKEENISYDFHFNGKVKKMTGYKMMDLDDNLIPSWYIDGQLPLDS